MIVKMLKTYVVSRSGERDRLLEALRELGVIHLTPVDAESAVARKETLASLDQLDRAIQILEAHTPCGDAPQFSALEAAEETLRIHRESAERMARLAALHSQLEHLEIWGDVRLQDFAELRAAGIDLRFFSAPAEEIADIKGQLVHVITQLPSEDSLVAVVGLDEQADLPENAEIVELPEQDCPSIRAEAAEIDEKLKRDAEELEQLAYKIDEMRAEHENLSEHAHFTVAQRGGLADEHLFAVQGWIPRENAQTLSENLSAAGIEAAVENTEPTEDDTPPTLVRYPRWASPIKALFEMLGTTPGYHEYDLSTFFMVALPLFAAMLIGDAGYGLIFLIVCLLTYRKLKAKAGKAAPQLILVFSLATLTWGTLTGNCFGVTPSLLIDGGGTWAKMGEAFKAVALLWDSDSEVARNLIIKISFVFGSVHLVLAHLRQAIGLAPSIKALAEIGWSSFLAGMLGVVWLLFFPNQVWMPSAVMATFLLAGAALFLLFTAPSWNPLKMIGMGLATSILPMVSTFSDTMSYIRLMAVGMASYYIASAFNNLAFEVGSGAIWLIPFAALIVIFAHALNIGLGLIAIFAHGVRLNLLEFSSNAGVQWTGSPYTPFAKKVTEKT